MKGGKQKLECKISTRIFAHKKHTSKYHSHKNDGLYTNVYNSVEKKGGKEERKKEGRDGRRKGRKDGRMDEKRKRIRESSFEENDFLILILIGNRRIIPLG